VDFALHFECNAVSPMAAQKQEAKRTPHFLWCQDMDRLLLRLQLTDVKIEETKLDITRDTFSFQWKNYELKFSFRFPVNPKTVKYRATRLLDLVIEKETSNAYWPHLLNKAEKQKLKAQCKVDWDRFLDEDEAKKRQKGIVDDDDGYGNLAGMGGMGGEDSSGDDSDDQPIDDLEVANDAAPKKEDEKEEEDPDEEMPALENEQNAQSQDANKANTEEQEDDNKEKGKDKAQDAAQPEEETVDVD